MSIVPDLVWDGMNKLSNGYRGKNTMKLLSVGLMTFAIAASSSLASLAQAQSVPKDIGDEITRALFSQSGDIYRNRGIDRQATLLFGLSQPEHEYFNDAQAVNKIYTEGMRRQGLADGVIRTQDLENPYDTSIRLSPELMHSGN
jgi:hypothetical protein